MKERTKQAIKCFFGFHPRNPKRLVPELAHYVITCHNGDTSWYELCPECARWYPCAALDREMDAEIAKVQARLRQLHRV